MRRIKWWQCASLVAACLGGQVAAAPAQGKALAPMPRADSVQESTPALARRILIAKDHRGLPFAIVDKRQATLAVYFGDGRLAGETVALLGQAVGDRLLPGIGERTQRGQLRSADMITPAGRFSSEPGRNLAGEAVVWIDYASAFSIHRLRPGPSKDRRARHLAAGSAGERRLSSGCVVVPPEFYDTVVRPVLGTGRGVVYVMAEEGPTQDL